MKIEQSDVSLFSSYQKSQKIEESESLHIWNKEEDAPQRLRGGDRLELSNNFKKMEYLIQSKNIYIYTFSERIKIISGVN